MGLKLAATGIVMRLYEAETAQNYVCFSKMIQEGNVKWMIIFSEKSRRKGSST